MAPGLVVEVRDMDWLVTSVDPTSDGQLLHVVGLSELLRGTTAGFLKSLDKIKTVDPADTPVVANPSRVIVVSTLWLESMRRKTPRPLFATTLTVSTEALADR